MQSALEVLRSAKPKYFTVDPVVVKTKALPRAIKAFQDVILAYLPADQGQLLMQVGAVATLFSYHATLRLDISLTHTRTHCVSRFLSSLSLCVFICINDVSVACTPVVP